MLIAYAFGKAIVNYSHTRIMTIANHQIELYNSGLSPCIKINAAL